MQRSCPEVRPDPIHVLVVYEGGTQGVSASSHTRSAGDLSDALRLTGAVTTTHSVSSSLLAQRAAPPERRKLMAVFVMTVIGVLFLRAEGGFFTIGLIMAGVGGYGLYNSIRFNRQYWPTLYQRWLGSWMCHKCGNIYQQ